MLIILLGLVVFGIGLCLDVVIVPLAVVLGLPGLIIYAIYERFDRRRRAKERLRERMQEALQI